MRTLIRLLVLVAALVLAAAGFAKEPAAGKPRPATVYVVRHAEQNRNADQDPPLSEDGAMRARVLRDELKSAGLSAVFSTPNRRSQGTALPVAQAFEIEVSTYEPLAFDSLATRIRNDFMGKSVLVVGHGNTVPRIISALGGPAYDDLDHDEFDKLFILAVYPDTTTCARLGFGKPYVPAEKH